MKRWIMVFAAALLISILVDFLRQGGGVPTALLGIHFPGLFALFGFIFCVIIVVVSKWLGHYWLQRKEGYYDRNGKHDISK